jgi:hypothetical protein
MKSTNRNCWMVQFLCCVGLQSTVVFNNYGVFYWSFALSEHSTISTKHKYTHARSHPEELQQN